MIELIKNDVYNKLKNYPYRLLHVLQVAQTAKSLAIIYNVKEEDAYLAGLIHDYAKYENNDFYLNHINKETYELNINNQVLFHGFAAANYFKDKYNINNEIYLAVYNHVFGRQNMNLLEQIVFVADAIYLNGPRNSRLIYQTATTNLNLATVLAVENTINDLTKRNLKISEQQLQVYEYYKGANKWKN